MKVILFVVFVGNYGGTTVEKVQYYNEAQCAESAKQFNEQKIKSGEVTAFCVRNNDIFK